MQMTVLGCSGGIGPGLRTTSLLLGDSVLIDAGTGVGDLDLAAQRRLRQVFLTHAHLDHVCGLAFLADNLLDEIDQPLRVHARAEVIDTLKQHLFNWHVWPDFAALPCAQTPLLQWCPLAPGAWQPLADGLRLAGVPAFHTVPAMGYAVEGPAGMLVFTGDTADAPELWAGLNALPRLDRLMIEIAFSDEEAALGELSRHFTPQRLAVSLQQLRHRPTLLLTHHKPGEESRIEAQCRTALADWSYQHVKRGMQIPL